MYDNNYPGEFAVGDAYDMYNFYAGFGEPNYGDYMNTENEPTSFNLCQDENGLEICCPGWRKSNNLVNSCDEPICETGCGVNGICIQPATCFCTDTNMSVLGSCDESMSGLAGLRHDELSCSSNINCNDGVCRKINGVEQCICPPGIEGVYCDQPICGDGCQNEGVCVNINQCRCKEGFIGQWCEFDNREEACYTKVNDLGKCEDKYKTEVTVSKRHCCSTIGHAWGHYCEPCAKDDNPCGQGYLQVEEFDASQEYIDFDEHCQDIDECKLFDNNICGGGVCKNTIGSFECICPYGYRLDADAKVCRDINECKENNYCPDHCTNTPGGWKCNCPEDYETGADGKFCIFNPEGTCFRQVDPPLKLPSKEDYANYADLHYSGGMGNFSAYDNSLYDPDVTYTCSQPYMNLVSKRDCCCGTMAGVCFGQANLCPRPGSLEWEEICVYTTKQQTTQATPQKLKDQPDNSVECPDNYCVNGYCTYDDVGILCVCFEKYHWVDDLQGCEKDSYCNLNEGVCQNGVCHNINMDYEEIGFNPFYCSCHTGFRAINNSTACENINECLIEGPNAVCQNGVCTDTIGSYNCFCNTGFTMKDGKCVDINECHLSAELCLNGKCYNTIGDYGCLCNPGFVESEDNHRCLDIDECTNASTCKNGQCKNKHGSYVCDCNAGFESKLVVVTNPATGDVTEESYCIDINECLDNPCQAGNCVNTEGSFKCQCDPFFMFDGASCVRDASLSTCSRHIDADSFQCIRNNTLSKKLTQTECCCANLADSVSAWGDNCNVCPKRGSNNFNHMCQDIGTIDYCVVLKELPCGIGGHCNSLDHDYECTCKIGFTLSSDRKDCIDIDECQQNFCSGPTSKCVNTYGSYWLRDF